MASNPAAPLESQRVESPSPAIAAEPILPWWTVWAALLLLAVIASVISATLGNDQRGLFMPVSALLVCLLAAGFDAATSHIPNPITYTAILLGLGLNTASGMALLLGRVQVTNWMGAVGPAQAFAGFGLCAGIGIVSLTLAGMGGGDVKLLVALGAILGFSQVSSLLLWTLMIAVPYALVNLIVAGRLNGIVRIAAAQLLQIVYLRRIEPIEPASRTSIPMAVPALVALFCMRLMPHWLGG